MRSLCPINYLIEQLGDKRSFLVIRDVAYHNKHTYKEFLASEEKIATNILADRLKKLESKGFLFHKQSESNKKVKEYYLTQKGIDLIPLLVQIIIRSLLHDENNPMTKQEKRHLLDNSDNEAIGLQEKHLKLLGLKS